MIHLFLRVCADQGVLFIEAIWINYLENNDMPVRLWIEQAVSIIYSKILSHHGVQ